MSRLINHSLSSELRDSRDAKNKSLHAREKTPRTNPERSSETKEVEHESLFQQEERKIKEGSRDLGDDGESVCVFPFNEQLALTTRREKEESSIKQGIPEMHINESTTAVQQRGRREGVEDEEPLKVAQKKRWKAQVDVDKRAL
ncbi:hypothetical protein MRX96_021306 [Rhipicephalus microplus]